MCGVASAVRAGVVLRGRGPDAGRSGLTEGARPVRRGDSVLRWASVSARCVCVLCCLVDGCAGIT